MVGCRRLAAVPFFLVCFGILLCSSLQAQDKSPSASQTEAPPHRPRVGLALSGGGALGLVEIGVIQWMEQNQIPVDRIAGTSMGSIIGVMYASGMSPNDIEAFARK